MSYICVLFFWIKLKEGSISTTASLRFPQDWFRPTIFVYPCNENQLDAIFILSLFHQSTSTCFGHICSQLSWGIHYIYNSWYVLRWKEGCLKF